MPETEPEIYLATINEAPPQRSLLRFIVALACGLFALSISAGSRGRFRYLLAEFDLAPSQITTFALGLLLPTALVCTVVATISLELLRMQASIKNIWNAIAIGIALACLAVYIIGVARPLLHLINGLS